MKKLIALHEINNGRKLIRIAKYRSWTGETLSAIVSACRKRITITLKNNALILQVSINKILFLNI